MEDQNQLPHVENPNQVNNQNQNQLTPVNVVAAPSVDPYDPKSIYYIHPQDNPNQNLISFTFTGQNFYTWERNISRALIWKQKFEFATGSIPRPIDNPQLALHWDRCSTAVMSWILASIEPKLVQSLSYCRTANKLWTEIRKRFTQNSDAEIYRLEKKIMELQQGSMDVVTYYNELMDAYKDLETVSPFEPCDCDCEKSECNLSRIEKKKVVKFLMGLNDVYKIPRSNILATRPLPDLGTVYSLIHTEEHQSSLTNSSVESPITNALVAGTQNWRGEGPPARSQGRANHHGKPQPRATVPSGTQQNLHAGQQTTNFGSGAVSGGTPHVGARKFPSGNTYSNIRCDICGGKSHNKERCYVIIGYPEWWTGRMYTIEDMKTRQTNRANGRANAAIVPSDPSSTDFTASANYAGYYNPDTDWIG